MKIRRLSPILGAEINGMNSSIPLNEEEFNFVHESFVTHSSLISRDQELSPEDIIDFSRRFGPLIIHVLKDSLLEGYPEIYKLSNRKKNGKPDGRPYAGQYWHSDLTYKKNPSLGSLLYGVEAPKFGGDTLFSSTAHTYDTLLPTVQTMLKGLTAEHLFAHAFRDGMNRPSRQSDPRYQPPPVNHPVLRAHSITGRKTLFINEGFTNKINELQIEESNSVLQFLFKHMTKSEVVYRHHWHPRDPFYGIIGL